jgi:hypothetical protein
MGWLYDRYKRAHRKATEILRRTEVKNVPEHLVTYDFIERLKIAMDKRHGRKRLRGKRDL